MNEPNSGTAEELYDNDPLFDAWEDDFEGEDEELFESFPPEFMAKSMADALERLKDFDPFAI